MQFYIVDGGNGDTNGTRMMLPDTFHPSYKNSKFQMAGKRVEKKFVLSDSTVNCYGFRLLTNGYQMGEFARNPIGYYMHRREEGVIVRWEGLAVEGDKITGYPVINMSNERGAQTLEEVESGFLNAASVGDIIVLEYSLEPHLMLPGQTGPTITKWTHKECSLVDVPGNANALTRLYDAADNALQIADLMGGLPHLQRNGEDKTIIPTMKRITLALTPNLFAVLNLPATGEPKEAETLAAIEDLARKAEEGFKAEVEVVKLKGEVSTLRTQLENLRKASTTDQIVVILDKAQEEGRVTNELRQTLAADYADKPEELQKLVNALPKQAGVAKKLKSDTTGLEGKTWDELHRSGKLQDLKRDNPEGYREVFKAHFGYYPA